MFLKSIYLKNFRNHTESLLHFNRRLTFFIGDNGEGKTNLLEAISLLSYLKSFRESDTGQLLKWSETNSFIRAEFESNGEDYLFEYGIERGITKRKKLKVNGDEVKKISDYVGSFRSIVLSPPDIGIIERGHSERRKFIDSFISSTNRHYLKTLIEYERLLKQRNAVLKKDNATESEIHIWTEPLIEADTEIRNIRKENTDRLAEFFHVNLTHLSSGKDPFFLTYLPNNRSKEEHAQKLKFSLTKDKALGYTSCGNHRDQFPIGFEDRDLAEFGSQGQKRSAVIALKTGAFEMMLEDTKEAPVLLIDDIIRELDVKRREYFVELISKCGQAFFTTTDLEGIADYVGNLSDEKQIFKIVAGKVEF